MVNYPWRTSNVNILEQFHRKPYVVNRNDQLGWNVFRVLNNRNQSYYTFRRSCEIDRIVRRMSFSCCTLQMDNQLVAVIHNQDFHRTGNIAVTLLQNSSDPHSDTQMFLAQQINMRRFMFPIFIIEKNMKRLVAQINAVPAGSSKLLIPDAYTFTVDITEETHDQKEIELVFILCLAIDEMRDYTADDDDDEEEFYNNS